MIEVSEWLIQNTAELTIELRGGAQRCQPGLHFASRWVGGLMPGQTVDYLPEQQLLEVRNLGEFAGILALDKWTCNINGTAGRLSKEPAGEPLQAPRLSTRDIASMPEIGSSSTSSLGGVFAENTVYRGVTGWASFEPWLSRIESFDPGDRLGHCGDDSAGLVRGRCERAGGLLERLLARRARVRELIVAFGESARRPFPNWGEEEGKEMGGESWGR